MTRELRARDPNTLPQYNYRLKRALRHSGSGKSPNCSSEMSIVRRRRQEAPPQRTGHGKAVKPGAKAQFPMSKPAPSPVPRSVTVESEEEPLIIRRARPPRRASPEVIKYHRQYPTMEAARLRHRHYHGTDRVSSLFTTAFIMYHGQRANSLTSRTRR
jgi:hypothetical protein